MTITRRYLKRQKAGIAGYLVLMAVSVVFTMATALSVADFLRLLFDEGQAGLGVATQGNLVAVALERVYEWLISLGQQRALLGFALLVLILYGTKNVASYGAAVVAGTTRVRLIRALRDDMFASLLRRPMSFFVKSKRGDLVARFGSDVAEYDENVLASLQMLATAVLSLLLYLAMLAYISLRLTLLVLVMLPIVAFGISAVSRKLKRKSAEVQEHNAQLMSMAEETMEGIKEIKAYTAIESQNQKFGDLNDMYTRLRIKMYRRIYLASPISDTLGNMIVVGILLAGSYMVMNGSELSPEMFISYIMMVVLMLPPAKDLSTALAQLKRGRACEERMASLLEGEDVREDTLAEYPGLNSQLTLEGLGFEYREGTPVLQDVDGTLKKGKMVALVGSSGSGKSTLADLLMRLYEPSEGMIKVDGTDLTQYSASSWRRHVGVVSQDLFLFNDTVYNNIAVADIEERTEEERRQKVKEAARMAHAEEFIEALPNGYETSLGEYGSRLSGGQRQRICIARALMRNPDLLILDEATSALDAESEHKVQEALEVLLPGRTSLVIAHRLQTIARADEIWVMEGGRIVERGTHKELLERGGRYKVLIEKM